MTAIAQVVNGAWLVWDKGTGAALFREANVPGALNRCRQRAARMGYRMEVVQK